MTNKRPDISKRPWKIYNTCRVTSLIDKKEFPTQLSWLSCKYSTAPFYRKMENMKKPLRLLKKPCRKLSNPSEYFKPYALKSSCHADYLRLTQIQETAELKLSLLILKLMYFFKLKNFSKNSLHFLSHINSLPSSKRSMTHWCMFFINKQAEDVFLER